MANRAFNTVGGSMYRLEELQLQIKKGAIHNDFVPVMGIDNAFALLEDTDQTRGIAPFILPIEVDGKYYVDLRTMKNKVSFNGNSVNIPTDGDAGFLRSHLLCTILWDQNPRTLTNSGKFPIIAFGSWVGQKLTNLHGLSVEASLNVKILACWWAYCQRLGSYENLESLRLDDSIINTAVNIMSSKLQGFRGRYVDIITSAGIIKNIDDFVKACNEMEPVALGTLKAAQVITSVSNSWHGTLDSNRLCAIALEYPPLFITFLAMANSGFYKKTAFTTIISNLSSGNFRRDKQQFERTYLDAMKSFE